MNIIESLRDPNLFRPFLGGKLKTWSPWVSALRVMYGLKLNELDQQRVWDCTGRDPHLLPADGFTNALFLTGRRSGKSRIAAVIGAYEAALAGHEDKLSVGEQGVVAICSPTKQQSKVVKKYLRAIFDTDILRSAIRSDQDDGFELHNGNRISILAGDWRTIRGFTLIAAIVDETAFFGHDTESKVRSDTELVRAIKPALATVGGKLICISSPYAKRGYCYSEVKKHHGNDKGKNLVWWAPSQTMNPTLPQSVIDEALEDDYAAARSEYYADFRDDVAAYIPRSVIEALVSDEVTRRPFQRDVRYTAFADLSGGRGDDAALAIAHRSEGRVVLDFIARYPSPFNPQIVIHQMVQELKRFNCKAVIGDNYAAEFVSSAFTNRGMRYQKSDKPKSVLYLELMPLLCSGEVLLLDNDLLINQLSSLERRTRSGGRDIIDHRPGSHDDIANAVAGVAVYACRKQRRIGAL